VRLARMRCPYSSLACFAAFSISSGRAVCLSVCVQCLSVSVGLPACHVVHSKYALCMSTTAAAASHAISRCFLRVFVSSVILIYRSSVYCIAYIHP